MNRRDYNKPPPQRKFPGKKFIPTEPARKERRPQRNETCPCDSGKKFKHCCKDVPTLIKNLRELIAAEEKENADSDNT